MAAFIRERSGGNAQGWGINPGVDRGRAMRVIKVYYPNDGAFNCWEPIVKAEMDRLKLTEAERKRTTVICSPESMRPKRKRQEAQKDE